MRVLYIAELEVIGAVNAFRGRSRGRLNPPLQSSILFIQFSWCDRHLSKQGYVRRRRLQRLLAVFLLKPPNYIVKNDDCIH